MEKKLEIENIDNIRQKAWQEGNNKNNFRFMSVALKEWFPAGRNETLWGEIRSILDIFKEPWAFRLSL